MIKQDLNRNGAIPGFTPSNRLAVRLNMPPRVKIERPLKVSVIESSPSTLDKFIDKSVDWLSRPKAIYVQTILTLGYVGASLVGLLKVDPFPFMFLNLVYSLASGYATVFVLNSNRRQTAEAENKLKRVEEKLDRVLAKLYETREK